jgi:cation diffusion facilitator family transporter
LDRTERVALLAAAWYALLMAYFFALAVLTHAPGMMAASLLTGLRLTTALLLVFGLRFSGHHSSTFPLGLYKLQNLVATVIGAFIIVISYELIKGSLWKLTAARQTAHGGYLALAGLVAAVVSAGFFTWYKARVGKRENSPALTADSRNSLADFLALAAILLGVGLAIAGVPHVNTVVAVIVGLYLFWVGGKVIVDSLKVLLDASVDRSVLQEARAAAEAHPLVSGVLDVRGRNSGNYRFINLSILVTTADLREARHVASDLERDIRGAVPNVDKVQVEFEVEPADRLLCAVPAEEAGGAVSGGFADAPSFELFDIDVTEGGMTSGERLANPVPAEAPCRGVRVAVSLARRGVGALLLRSPLEDDDVAGTLEAYEVEVLVRPGAGTLGQAESELAGYARSLDEGSSAGAGVAP